MLIAVAMLATAGSSTAGNPVGIFNAGFSPTRLSPTKPTPIAFGFSIKVKAGEGGQPPALREFRLESDKHARLDVRGIPTCKLGGRDVRRNIAEVRKACRPALVGEGRIEARVQFPGQPPLSVQSELLALNGGVKGGMTKLYLHAVFPAPVTAWIVIPVEIRRISRGRFGTAAIASVPKIAGGSGSVTSFNLTLKKGIVSATCPDGRLKTRGAMVFADGARQKETVARTCMGRG
jgi:hypothetical protein